MGMKSSCSASKVYKMGHPNLAWKGYKGKANNCLRIATQRMQKGLQFSTRDRRNRKRDFRSLWNLRINAATHQHGITLCRADCDCEKPQSGLPQISSGIGSQLLI